MITFSSLSPRSRLSLHLQALFSERGSQAKPATQPTAANACISSEHLAAALAVPYPFTRGESNGTGKWYVRSWASGHRGLVDQITARNSRPLRKWPAVFTPIRSKFLPFLIYLLMISSPRRLSRSDVILASVQGAVYSELPLFICKARSKAFFLKGFE